MVALAVFAFGGGLSGVGLLIGGHDGFFPVFRPESASGMSASRPTPPTIDVTRCSGLPLKVQSAPCPGFDRIIPRPARQRRRLRSPRTKGDPKYCVGREQLNSPKVLRRSNERTSGDDGTAYLDQPTQMRGMTSGPLRNAAPTPARCWSGVPFENPFQKASDMDRNEQIRQRAHQIWEANGCPEGQEAAHWQQAEDQLREEERLDAFDLPQAGDPQAALSDDGTSDLPDAGQETGQFKQPGQDRQAD